MAETEPTFAKAPQDERDKVAKLQRELEKAQFDATQKEAFGKFDVTVPNEGEETYQSYLDKRPAAGIIRNGEVFQNAETGKFGSEAAYEAQKGTADDYYTEKGELANKGEYQPPKYEAMGVFQLAKEAAKARQLGDPAEEKTIRESLEHYLTMDVMKDDTESPEEAQARFDKEVASYDKLVDRFVSRAEASAQHADNTHANPSGEGTPSVRVEAEPAQTDEPAAAEAEPAADTSAAEVPGTAVELVTEPEAAEVVETPVVDAEPATEAKAEDVPQEPGGYYNGKKVSVARVLENDPKNQDNDRLLVIDSDGAEHEVLASDIKYVGAPAIEAADSDDGIAALESITEEQNKTPGKELEVYDGEKAKKWWQKAGDYIRPRAGIAFWAAKFETVKAGAKENHLNWRVNEEDSDEVKEKKHQRNRVIAIAAGSAVAVAALAGGVYLVANGLSSGSSGDVVTNIGLGEHKDWTSDDAQTWQELIDPNATDRVGSLPLDGVGDVGAETIPEVPVSTEAIDAASGEGGEALFTSLNIDPAKWYSNANTLLQQFPQDFYLEGNDVRIAHTGPLSQGAQDFINSLR